MFNDGNLDGIPATYTENAVIYMNEENPIIGRRAIGELLTKIATKFKTIEVEKWEFFEQFNDNTAYALGITKHAMQPDGKQFRRNKGSILCRKIDGKWYVDNYVFNTIPQ
ncbi:hypothetical protein LSH36_185g05065 [Paralvinella palmiformis]|uniref:Uncharacterized protein n=1 Tax=Paralvinella palmiformis TaxID=53620 RepID=A0AAD9JSC7_9ANNE|nr:hypothetical protein LSH36_185g05065 [Paralvinella palmiformis]